MRLLLPVLLGLLLAACGGTTEESTFATVGDELDSTTPLPVSGLERLCEAFSIVNTDVSPAYDSVAADPSDGNVQIQGLAIMVAGSDIADLAEGVTEPGFVEILERMGEEYIAEGEKV
jgi:hypothetical protein